MRWRHAPVVERLWLRVDRSDAEGCWPWTGAIDHKGYGAIQGPGPIHRVLKTHRVAYEAAHGPLGDGECVLHRCDNPRCCNPAHLFVGTIADNNRDMWSKGRGRTNWEGRERDAAGRFT